MRICLKRPNRRMNLHFFLLFYSFTSWVLVKDAIMCKYMMVFSNLSKLFLIQYQYCSVIYLYIGWIGGKFWIFHKVWQTTSWNSTTLTSEHKIWNTFTFQKKFNSLFNFHLKSQIFSLSKWSSNQQRSQNLKHFLKEFKFTFQCSFGPHCTVG